ncbi:xaa-Pro aminopeptidase ApepP [Drosophila takahashii]|uniref:xaa-Pro aminopeptidase ApepP n=1 Tax=Drosophila takahashii TaxID=29030 RepID=UPI001CF82DC6|nr:xaa-Pro aminopeptidase ApepP [Drosophila takahashii]XP_017006987.2 xaa-Pro aminopeptidase ApepP [Drosophila takahashii]XP_017006988.2 xaa-Pro aminopeptidase ApepP [Drosophila takahashii]
MKRSTTQILAKLRELMLRAQVGDSSGISAYIVPSDDAHQSEYQCQHDERRSFVSGFDGSAGTAVVTTDTALLWTDGRYYQQAEKQLDSNWVLMRDGLTTTPSIGAWLAKNLPKGSFVGVDPRLLSFRVWKPIETELNSAECQLVPIEKNLIDEVWGEDQPAQTSNTIISLKLEYSGVPVAKKWQVVRKQLKDKNVDALVVSALDEIAWFLNLRGSDIDFNPVFFSYLIVTHDELLLFVDSGKLPADFAQHQTENNVKISVLPYASIGLEISKIVSSKESKIWIAPTSSYYLTALIPKSRRIQEVTPICVLKSIKNDVEIEGFVNSHIRDGVALCQYFAWLEDQVNKGAEVDEISGSDKLESFRASKDKYMGLSFTTISASGPNGSVIHYHPKEETNRKINDKEIYLCDSGAQYLDGTTDVTRTLHFGQPTEFQKEAYTRVLKGQLSFGATVFPAKVKGQVLDTLARKALWDVGLDYGHGTGHGVGHFLNVHEGPMGVGIRLMPDDPGLQANMFISNEPGFYQDGEFGIRVEDIVQIVPGQVAHNFASRGALTFKTITMCPKQTKMIKKELLSDVEIKLLNAYHQQVWETLSPILSRDGDEFTLSWLKKEVQPI